MSSEKKKTPADSEELRGSEETAVGEAVQKVKKKEKMPKEKKRKIWKIVIGLALLIGANMLFFLTQWLATRYDRVSLEQILYQLQTSVKGTSRKVTHSAFAMVLGWGSLATALELCLYFCLAGHIRKIAKKTKNLAVKMWRWYKKYCATKVCAFFAKHMVLIPGILLVSMVLMFLIRLEVFNYISYSITESSFIEEHYVDPDSVELKFPEQKRNVIYIFLESMENTFADCSACDTIADNYIPNLTQYTQDYVSFSNTEGMGGAQSLEGTTWTVAAMVAQTSGVTVKVPLIGGEYGEEDYYMPGITVLGDVLEEAGYRQVLLLGSVAEFANRDTYFGTHGHYDIIDIEALKRQSRIPEDYFEWWGYEDEKLFAYAKEELTRLGQEGQPFNFTMLTADTHFPDGHLCRLCRHEYSEQYGNVIRCNDTQLKEFIDWIQAQPFYENTTIVLSGDHLTMDPEFLEEIDESYIRTSYNCIINSAVDPVNTKNRQFGTIDMFPTTLAAMGVEIEGDRLGLGTNLFSDKKTLSEEYGHEFLNDELQKHSEFYFDTFFTLPPEEEDGK